MHSPIHAFTHSCIVILRRAFRAEGSMQLAGSITGAGKLQESFLGSHSLRERLRVLMDDNAIRRGFRKLLRVGASC